MVEKREGGGRGLGGPVGARERASERHRAEHTSDGLQFGTWPWSNACLAAHQVIGEEGRRDDE